MISKKRNDPIKRCHWYGNDMEYDIERVSQSSTEDDNNSYLSGYSQEMEIDTRINEE